MKIFQIKHHLGERGEGEINFKIDPFSETPCIDLFASQVSLSVISFWSKNKLKRLIQNLKSLW